MCFVFFMSSNTVPNLAHPCPALPEVEELSLLRFWSKLYPCCRSSLAGKGHPVYPPFSLQNSMNLWGTRALGHMEQLPVECEGSVLVLPHLSQGLFNLRMSVTHRYGVVVKINPRKD